MPRDPSIERLTLAMHAARRALPEGTSIGGVRETAAGPVVEFCFPGGERPARWHALSGVACANPEDDASWGEWSRGRTLEARREGGDL